MITLTDICINLGVEYSLQGPVENMPYIKGPKSLDDTSAAAELSFSFCEHPGVNSLTRRPVDNLDNVLYPYTATETEIQETIKKVLISACPVIICPCMKYPLTNKTLIKVVNPRLAFMNVMQALYKVSPSIHPTAVIADCVEIGNNVSIGPNTVIGFDGFGMWRRETGELMKFPQIGRVIIKNDVEIKANVCIDRGALGDTIIGEGSKIDNLVHISHNVIIGKNVAIVAKAMIGGSARIGDESWIAPNASVLNGVVIGKRCVVGMGSVVLKDVPDDTTVKGVPAK